jgi:hypothetical protein
MRPRWIRSEAGFVLPLVVGVGAVLMLLGTMMIIRASQNDRTAIASKATSRSLAVAEAGLTHFQSLINRNRILATLPSWDTWNSNDICPGVPDPNPVTYSQDFPSRWNDLGNSDTNGQFRLVKYTYTPGGNPTIPNLIGNAELIVEGRVNQEGGEDYRISTTRLAATFQVERSIRTSTDLPTLWIRSSQDSSVAPDVMFISSPGFYIWDSSCPNQSAPAQAQQFKSRLDPNFSDYREIPGLKFPELPSEGRSRPSLTTGVYELASINSPATPLEFPTSTQVLNGDKITYIIPKIELTGGEIRFRKPRVTSTLQEVNLYLDDSNALDISGGGKITVEPGIKLKIYAHGSISLISSSSNSTISSSDLTQIYSYTPDSIVISGSSNPPLNLFIFAPQSPVIFTDGANVRGGVWSRSLQGGSSAILERNIPGSPFYSSIQVPRIKPISSWRRCRLPTPLEPADSCPAQ